MVLYKTSQRGEKHDRDNWVMREYHLGEEEAKKDGELVVSKIFYQLANKSMQIYKTETTQFNQVEQLNNCQPLTIAIYNKV